METEISYSLPISIPDMDPDVVLKTITILNSFGFDCFETEVGGPGVGITAISSLAGLPTAEEMQQATRDSFEGISGWKYL